MRRHAVGIVTGAVVVALLGAVGFRPSVSAAGAVVENSQSRIVVTGYVKTPATYPHKAGMTVQDAIDSAGGLTMESPRIDLVRTVDGKQTRRRVLEKETKTTTLNPDDTVDVRRAKI